jgi:O-antigen ligase
MFIVGMTAIGAIIMLTGGRGSWSWIDGVIIMGVISARTYLKERRAREERPAANVH